MTKTTRDVVLAAIARVCVDKGQTGAPPSDRDELCDGGLGLDSLDMATIVAELDLVLHKDPFAEATPRFQTVGDLIALYESGSGR